MLSSESVKTLQALYEEIEKMKGNLSKDDQETIDDEDINSGDETPTPEHGETTDEEEEIERAEQIESNEADRKCDAITSELSEGMDMLEELKVKNSELISHVVTLQGQYEEGVGELTAPSPVLKDSHPFQFPDDKIPAGNIGSDGHRDDISVDECCCKELSLKLDLLVAENMKYEMTIAELKKVI